jgi:hypothetical protein
MFIPFWGSHTQPVLHVHRRCRAFEDTESLDDGWWHPVLRLIDLEVLQRALCLRTPILVGRHLDLAKGIGFCASGSHPASECELATRDVAVDVELSAAGHWSECGRESSGAACPRPARAGGVKSDMCERPQ